MHGLQAASFGVSFTQNATHEEIAKGRSKKPKQCIGKWQA